MAVINKYHACEERVCKHSTNGSVEDKFHFAFKCHKYDNLRNNCNNNE